VSLSNSGSRVSHSVKLQSAHDVLVGAGYAWCLGLLLNRYVTLHVENEEACHRSLSHITARMSDWLRYQKLPLVYVYSWESRGFGVHVNFLVHVPHGQESLFDNRLRSWISKSGITLSAGVCRSQPIQNSAPGDDPIPYLTQDLPRLLSYVLKGLSRADAARLGIESSPQGRVTGKRTGHSESLSASRVVWPTYESEGLTLPGFQLRRRRLLEICWSRTDFPLPPRPYDE
jgi:hypothetical protein